MLCLFCIAYKTLDDGQNSMKLMILNVLLCLGY